MKTIAPILALFAFGAQLQAQAPDFGGKTQIAEIKKLHFLVGSWSGKGWIEAGGRRIEFEGTEKVSYKAGGTAMAVEGLHSSAFGDRKVVIHDAYAMIVFDQESKKHRMTAQLANGLRNSFDLTVSSTGFQWMLPASPSGPVRYTMTLTEKGEWREIGETQSADGSWKPMMEMVLKKERTRVESVDAK